MGALAEVKVGRMAPRTQTKACARNPGQSSPGTPSRSASPRTLLPATAPERVVIHSAAMISVGLVCSAGGWRGDPWHSGVLARLAEISGFDARTSELIVGTSAGSFTGSALRAGLSAADCAARFGGGELSEEGRRIVARVTTPYEELEMPRSLRPSAPSMACRALLPPWDLDPIRFGIGLLPPGKVTADAITARIDELLPGGWPDQPLWVVAVRTSDGRRVVFGRDDVFGTVGEACQASSAIPGYYHPVMVGPRTYIDGAVHSATNADLVAALGFDLVVVSSVMTAVPEARSWARDPKRAWFSTKLDAEAAAIRSHGTTVIVIEPDADQLAGFAAGAGGGASDRALMADAGRAAVDRALSGSDSGPLRSLLSQAAD